MDDLTSLADVITSADAELSVGQSAAGRAWPTGFDPLDEVLAGGLHSGELTLLGGPQGLGKTTLALQAARHVVVNGGAAVYLSFEHDAPLVLSRMLALEAAMQGGDEAPDLGLFRKALQAEVGVGGDLAERMSGYRGGAEAVRVVAGWGARMLVHRSNGSTTDLTTIRSVLDLARERSGLPPLLVVDYLQKVPAPGLGGGEEERVTRVVEDLKDLALAQEIPVLAIVAADREGITSGKRLRTHHLRGSTALAYEADVVLVINDKFDVVARHHLVYDVNNADRFRDYVVLSVEKNRNGRDHIDLEFRKYFAQSRFDPNGRMVAETLVDDRVFTE